MRKCPKFIVGRIHGKCVGGGVGIAAAVDYAIALDKADVKLSELAIGFGPFVIAPAVERKIGTGAFSALRLMQHYGEMQTGAIVKIFTQNFIILLKTWTKRWPELRTTLSHSSPRSDGRTEKCFMERN